MIFTSKQKRERKGELGDLIFIKEMGEFNWGLVTYSARALYLSGNTNKVNMSYDKCKEVLSFSFLV